MNDKLIIFGTYLTKLLGDMANGRKSVLIDEEDFDWAEFYKFADFHNVANMLYYQIKDFDLPDDVMKIYVDSSKKAVSRCARFEFMSDKICNMLEKADIEYALLKGKTLQKFYPIENMRISTDVDILLQNKNRSDVEKIMLAENFEKVSSADDEDVYHKNPIYSFEMHFDVIKKESYFYDYFSSYFGRSKKGDSNCREFSGEDQYIYNLFHLYNHYSNGGCGVRMFLDMYLIDKKLDLDYDYIENELAKIDLIDFNTFVRKMCKVLFDDVACEENEKLLLRYIFTSGTFGTWQVGIIANIQKQIDGKKFFFKKVKYVLKSWFLGLKPMQALYPVLNRFPFLLPFCWIHKGIYTLLFKRSAIKNQIEESKSFSTKKSDILDNIKKMSGVRH